ncbi:hypothetical protein CcCBS67573_g02642 [Chytriomyces confervae]|uniref:RlpA-like protein double-psi beta-barrel domain-containing protein n=1 Tax=Chytriomyces confervae TaxID=246404 RepID=A0A507FKY8_9FUNG|nr:hypothetical protein CcCBS67573_g02642 [Chytriomyces confervae]
MLLLTSLLAFAAGTALAGDLTFYEPAGGRGSCGNILQNGDIIAAMNEVEYDRDPSMCGRLICISYNGQIVRATVQDRCAGCPSGDVDVTPVVFERFRPREVGRFGGVSWFYCDAPNGNDNVPVVEVRPATVSSSGSATVSSSGSATVSSSGNATVSSSGNATVSSNGNATVSSSENGSELGGNSAGDNGGLPSCTKGAMSTETCKCHTNHSVIPSNTMCPCSESSDCSASEVCKKYTGQCIPKCTLGQKSTSVCSCSTAKASRPFIRAGKVCSCTEDSQCGNGKTCAFGYCQKTSTPADWFTCSDAAQLAKAVLLCAVPDSCNVPCLVDPRLLTLRNAKVPTDAMLVDFCHYFIDEKNGSFEGCTKTDKAPVENGLDAWVATLKELCHEK